ncbi:MAG: hypothetical protein WCJ45_00100 [bacterium]
MKVKIQKKGKKETIEISSLNDLTYGKMSELVTNHGRDPIAKIEIIIENKDNYLGSNPVEREDLEKKWAGLGSQLTELSHRYSTFGNKIKIKIIVEAYTHPRIY